MAGEPIVRLVFVSYAHKDRDFVERLIADLQSHNVAIWVDRERLKPGTPDWEETVRAAIRSAEAVLLVASQSSRESRYVRDELRIAEMYQRRLFPVWMDGEQFIDSVPMGYGSVQYVDLRGQRYEEGLAKIVEALGGAGDLAVMPVHGPEPDFEPRNPYKSLQAFRVEDAADFFGRGTVVAALVREITTSVSAAGRVRLLTVAGPSGVGKSSVVMAGLLPRLQAGAIPGSATWVYLEPVTPGARPLEALTETLARATGRSFASVREDLDDESALGLDRLARLLATREDGRVVLLIDQFEELFAQSVSEAERAHFLDLMRAAVSQSGPLILLLTVRADFYDRIMPYGDLWDAVKNHTYFVAPMTTDELREAIEGPAPLPDVQLTFDPDLVGDLLFDVRGQAGALPLLEFTLDDLFQRRDGHRLTMTAYRESGGVLGALSNRAEAVYANLPDDEHRALARRLFLRLIDPGTGAQDTVRRRARLSELTLADAEGTARMHAVAEAFIGARLLTTSGQGPATTIEVSHEALIQEWQRLADWLHEARNDIRLQHRISSDAATWLEREHAADYLYRGAGLAEADAWAQRNTPSADEQAFLDASRAESDRLARIEHDQQQRELQLARRAAARLRALVGVLGGAVVVAAILTGLALESRAAAVAEAGMALSSQLATQSENLRASTPDLALLLGVQAVRASDTVDARASLLDALTSHPGLVGILPGSGGDALSAVFSPNGKMLGVGSSRGDVQLWNVAPRRPIGRPLVNLHGEVFNIAFSPDGRLVAAGDNTGEIAIWNASTGNLVAGPYQSDTCHLGVLSLAFSPGGRILAAANADGTISRWNVAARRPAGPDLGIRDCSGGKAVGTVAYGRSGRLISASEAPMSLQSWGYGGGNTPRLLGRPPQGRTCIVDSATFGPRAGTLAACTGNTIALWNVVKRHRLAPPIAAGTVVDCIAWSLDGRSIAWGNQNGSIVTWDVALRRQLATFRGIGPQQVEAVAFSPNGRLLAAASTNGSVALWNTRAPNLAGPASRELKADQPLGLSYSHDGKKLVWANYNGSLSVWNVTAGRLDGPPLNDHVGRVFAVALDPNGKLVAGGDEAGNVVLWNDVTRQVVGRPLATHDVGIDSIAFSPNGRILATSSFGEDSNPGKIILWDVAKKRPTGSTLSTGGGGGPIAFNPDGKLLASVAYKTGVTLWNVESGRPDGPHLQPAGTVVSSVAFSPDGKTLVTGNEDGSLTLWSIQTRQPVYRLTGGTGSASDVAFSPDGSTIASIDQDGNIDLWDVASRRFIGIVGNAGAIAFSPDGSTLAGTWSNAVVFWDTRTEAWARQACALANRNLTRAEWKQYLGNRPYERTCPGLP